MDIKGHSTMIIAMAIAVVVMTGVMVPVISDALDSAGGGGGSGSDNEPYVNSGTAYLKAWDSNEHLITITDSNVNVVFNYDGTDVLTMAKGSEGWCIPVTVCEGEENGGVATRIACFTYSIADGIGLTNLIGLGIWQDSEGAIGDAWKNQIYASAQDTVFTIEIYEERDYKYAEVLVNGEFIGDSLTGVTKFLSDNSGEYVYAESPVVTDGTEVIQMNCYYAHSEAHGSTPSEFTIVEGFSKGDISYLSADYDNYWNIIGFADTSVIMVDGNDYALDDILSCTLSTETLDNGTRINGMTVETLWYYQSDEFTRTYTFDMYIAPKVATPMSEGNWKMADGSESMELYVTIEGDYIVLWNGSDNPVEVCSQKWTDSNIMPVAIFDKAIVIAKHNVWGSIHSARLEVYGIVERTYDSGGGGGSELQMSITRGDPIAESSEVWRNEWLNDTLVISDGNAEFGPSYNHYRINGLIAYASPEGDAVLSSAPVNVGSNKFYTAISMYDYQTGGGYNAMGYGTADKPALNIYKPEGDGIDVTVNVALQTSNTMINGATATGSIVASGYDTETIDHTYEFGFYPDNDSEYYDEDVYMMYCLTPLNQESGGGGSGASDTLRAMVSAIPIVMIAGLVIMGVGFMRMGQ